jgi:hypothetical protein
LSINAIKDLDEEEERGEFSLSDQRDEGRKRRRQNPSLDTLLCL